jgi:hypothetical protein
MIFSCLNSLHFSRLSFRFVIASLLFFSVCLSVASSSSLFRFCRWDGTVDAVFSTATKGGGDGDVVVEEVTVDGVESVNVEVAGDGRVIAASLAHQNGIAGANDIELVDGDGERDGATPANSASTSCLSAPLQPIDGSASCFGRHQDRNLPWLVVYSSVR